MSRRFKRIIQQTAWRAAHPEFFRHSDPRFHKDEFRLLRVSTEFWSAAALWKKSAGAWSCVSADSHLSWMIGKTHAQAHLELLKLEADYSWEKGTVSGSPCTCSFSPDKVAASRGSTTNEPDVRPADGHRLSVKATRQSANPAAPA